MHRREFIDWERDESCWKKEEEDVMVAGGTGGDGDGGR